jgi:hypothetical protein
MMISKRKKSITSRIKMKTCIDVLLARACQTAKISLNICYTRYQMPRNCFVFAYRNGALEINDEDYYVVFLAWIIACLRMNE